MINNFEELLEDLRDYLDAYQYQTDLVIGAGSKTLEWAIYDYLSHAVSDRMTLKRAFFTAPALSGDDYEAPCSKSNNFDTVMFDYLLVAMRVSVLEDLMTSTVSRQVRETLQS